MNKVLIVEKSQNQKTGLVSATYAPIQTCPKTCPHINGGCYAQYSFCGIYLKKINNSAKGASTLDLAKEEASGICNLSGKYPLRLHVVGDCTSDIGAQVISKACQDYILKYNKPVWTYTHSWKKIKRASWGTINILASCESISDVEQARKLGYAAALTTSPFSKTTKKNNFIFKPCPEMVKGIKCVNCKLCMNTERLYKSNKIICLFPHGSGKDKVQHEIIA